MGVALHHVGELSEEIVRIVRSWRRFGMVLDAEKGQLFVAHAFVGVVVEIHVGNFNVARRERFGVDAEAVILGGDFDFLGEEVLHGMIRAVMAEFQFEGLAAKSETAELMAEADAKDRNAAEELLDIFDGIAHRLRIAGTIGKKNTVGLEVENVLRTRLRGDNPNIAVMIDQQTENVLLDAEIVGRYAKFSQVGNSARFRHGFGPRRNRELNRAFLPTICFLAGDPARQFLPGHRRHLLGFENQLLGGRAVRSDNTAERADIANVPNERARVDIPNNGNFVAVQIKLCSFRGSPIRGHLRKLPNHKSFYVRPRSLFIIEIGPDVPDVRICKTNDLPRVAGVRKDFLIAGQAGIEDHFPAPARDRAGSAAVKDASVFQCERSGPVRNFGQIVLLLCSSQLAVSAVCAHFLVLASVA